MLYGVLQGGREQFPLARGSRVRCKRFINVTVTFAIMVEIAFVGKRIFNVILLVDLRIYTVSQKNKTPNF